jgi:hypothetical protein
VQLSVHLASLRYKLQHHGGWASNATTLGIVAEEVVALRGAIQRQRDDVFLAICENLLPSCVERVCPSCVLGALWERVLLWMRELRDSLRFHLYRSSTALVTEVGPPGGDRYRARCYVRLLPAHPLGASP